MHNLLTIIILSFSSQPLLIKFPHQLSHIFLLHHNHHHNHHHRRPMDRSSDDQPPPRRELQGPRPTPLKVRKDSHKIKKPPIPPAVNQHAPPNHPPPPRPPVIIYAVSPKIIHTNPSEFMTLVQRLTGPGNSSIEKTKMPPQAKNMTDHPTGYEHLFSTRPGGSILSPGPSGLTRPVPPAFFSDPISPLVSLYHQHQQDHFSALQQIQYSGAGNYGYNCVLPSPSPAAFLSPNTMLSPASIEFLTRLLD